MRPSPRLGGVARDLDHDPRRPRGRRPARRRPDDRHLHDRHDDGPGHDRARRGLTTPTSSPRSPTRTWSSSPVPARSTSSRPRWPVAEEINHLLAVGTVSFSAALRRTRDVR
jgi:hypothetical protein